jgi:cytochrome c peroxidase
LFLLILLCSRFTVDRKAYNTEVYNLYLEQIGEVEHSLRSLPNGQSGTQDLKKWFLQTRLSYKKLAVLSEFFDVPATKYLNGPALRRVEEDHPDEIIPPHGYQLLEEKVYSGEPAGSIQAPLQQEVDFMMAALERMKQAPDLALAFKDENIWEALRLAVLRVITLGITGFDSPVAKLSVAEAAATLQGLQPILNFYQRELDARIPGRHTQFAELIAAAGSFLSVEKEFDNFDRLYFIKQFGNPLTVLLTATRNELGFFNATDRGPVSREAASLFDPSFFNLSFFSPNERYTTSIERIMLGKLLFSDPILSRNKKFSCRSCHLPEKAFTDGLPKAIGIDQHSLDRNTPTLWNSVFQTRQFYDSRTVTLENQFSEVVHNEKEMSGSLRQLEEVLAVDQTYGPLFRKAYPAEKNPVTQFSIANAVACYVRSLVSLNSRFDLYMRGHDKSLTTEEQAGFNLFAGKGKCATCHFLPLFNGLVPPDFNETESEVLGIPKTNKRKTVLDDDRGKFNFTHSPVHQHSFKIPTVRNIALTAPYMHNGVFTSLEQVLEFYDRGGGAGLHIGPENQTLPRDKLHLSSKEKKAIIAFLRSLTDTAALH